jgi:hypothetical protein
MCKVRMGELILILVFVHVLVLVRLRESSPIGFDAKR